MDLGLKGLRAVVTGGTKGIGRAIVETLLKEGAQVAFCARNPAEVAAAEAELSRYGVKVLGRAVDVADGPTLAAFVAEAQAALGGIDIVVANVSALAIGNDEAGWKSGFDVDMMGTVRLINAAMPSLERATARPSSRLPVCPHARSTLPPDPTARSKPRSFITRRAWPFNWRAKKSGLTRCRLATPTFLGVSGRRSKPATRRCLRNRLR